MLKHVGRMANNKRKIVVAYKLVPNELDHCIVVTTENLMSEEHDALIKLVESAAGQESEDLATAMARTSLPDGRNMLASFHQTGKMVKVPTNTVEMTPTTNNTIMLNELNDLIADQRGVTLTELALADPAAKNKPEETKKDDSRTDAEIAAEELPKDEGVLTDEQLATQYRSQASAMYKEAKRLREEAEKLSPTKKKKPAAKNSKENA